MSSLAATFVCSASRPLQLQLRQDLVARRQDYLGRRYWVVKDPLALRYFRFEEEEYELLQMLDGRSSLDQIRRRFETQFKPQRISIEELHQFFGAMHRNNLVTSAAVGQGDQLRQRRAEREKRERWATFSNILCVRFKGVDPDRFLTWLNRRAGWFFSLPAFFCCLALALSALTLVAAEFETFQARMPSFHNFFAAKNWVWLAATLAITKVMHEIGHGLACKRFGGECHEMGMMLLVLTPCLYCNVSDSWMLPDKWKRAFIGAAGMYVEIFLASICTFVWWFTHPGMLNYLALNIMFVCSVSTLLFNANPLMRYDGYYILSDVIEIPNLRQKATTILQRWLCEWTLGLPQADDPFLPQRRQWLFALYSIASVVYRWFVVFGILWLLNRMFEPYGLQVLGRAIACLSIYGMIIHPLWKLASFLRAPGRMEQVNKFRLSISLAAGAGCLAAILCIPLPYYVRCTVHVEPLDAEPVYVEAGGEVQQILVRPGDRVVENQPLMQLDNIDLRIAIREAVGRREELLEQIRSIEQLYLLNAKETQVAYEIDQLRKTVATVEQQIRDYEEDLARLVIRAPRGGEVQAAPRMPANERDDRLGQWRGLPTDAANLGAFYRKGQLLCRVGNARNLQATLLVPQEEVKRLFAGQDVEMVLDGARGRMWRSKVEYVSNRPAKQIALSLSAKSGGPVPTETDVDGREKPLEPMYQVSAPLTDEVGDLFIGATGAARVRAGSETIAQRIYLAAARTIRFEL